MAARGASFEEAITAAGCGRFQRRLLGVFGLVWAADAMQVLAVGFTAPSIAASFGLSVPVALQAGTAFFLGMMAGAFVLGRLADRVGRRPILVAGVAIDLVFGIASAFAPGFEWLLVLRFLTGIGVGGTLPVDYAMMAEVLPPDRRGRWLVTLEGFWAVGTVLLALVAFVVEASGFAESWRAVLVATTLPALVGIAMRFGIPESPLFLLRKGRHADAAAVLAEIARVNGRPPVPMLAPAPARGPRPSFAALFSGPLKRRTPFVLLVWLFVSASYYGVFVWLPVRLAAEGHGFLRGQFFLVFVALAQIPGYALAAYGVEKWGRRPTLIGFLLLTAAGCSVYAIGSSAGIATAATLLMSFAFLGTWGALYTYTPEIFPTELRSTGMGSAGAMARLGGLLAPSLLAPAMAAGFGAMLAVFAALLCAAALMVAAVGEETRRKALA